MVGKEQFRVGLSPSKATIKNKKTNTFSEILRKFAPRKVLKRHKDSYLLYSSCMAHVWLMYGSCMAHVWLMYG
ncbi:hypothetical protein GCM10010976_33710 [Bizionia arctica]|uniref:Uncharacterized protein n=1 Tax=Bizionia arctica TaxID=1495645 RepID=A0A917GY84_9FLAO|nr:hypothetical protein GCM10010976_33710 [Bizionia arctica]